MHGSDSRGTGPERALIGSLYDQYASWLLAVCLRYTGNRENAQDVLQEGFIKIIKNYESYKPTGNIKFWMRKIMVNTALNYIRDHEKEKIFTDMESSTDMIREQDPSDEEEYPGEFLMEMVSSLPTGYRLVFNLYVMEDYSHKEISEMLGISENTSRTQLLKARNYLKKRLIVCKNKTQNAERARSGR